MSLDAFAMPGGDPFKKKKDEPPKKSWDDIFRKPIAGGGGGAGAAARHKAEEEAKQQIEQEAEDYYKNSDKVKDPVPPPKPVVVLSHPNWSAEQGFFNEKIKSTVESALPEDSKKSTLVEFTLHAILPNGELERIEAQDGLIKNGKAEADLTLYWPQHRDEEGNLLASCDYIFSAKHMYSEKIKSKALKVTQRPFSLKQLRQVLETLEKEKGPDAVRIFVGALSYQAICDLAKEGTPDNDPNHMPTRFFLIPGADDSKLETMDSHPEGKSHKFSVSNLRKGLNTLGYGCALDGPFDQSLQDAFEKFLQSLPAPKQSEATGLKVHKVQKGETLGGIAMQYGLPSWRSLYSANKSVIGNNPDLIRIGRDLEIPDRGTARGEQLIRQKGGDSTKMIGGVKYAYPWVHFSLSLTDDNGSSINLERAREFTLTLPDKETVVHSGKLSGQGPYSIFIPHGKDFDLKVVGFDLGEMNV